MSPRTLPPHLARSLEGSEAGRVVDSTWPHIPPPLWMSPSSGYWECAAHPEADMRSHNSVL